MTKVQDLTARAASLSDGRAGGVRLSDDGRVTLALDATGLSPAARDALAEQVRAGLLAVDGVSIRVAAGCKAAAPLHIVHVAASAEAAPRRGLTNERTAMEVSAAIMMVVFLVLGAQVIGKGLAGF